MALASDALQQDWSHERNYAFPPFCLIMRSLAKLREKGRRVNNSYPNLANTGLVSQPFRHVRFVSNTPSIVPELASWSMRGDTPLNPERNLDVGRVARIQQSLQSKGICEDASQLILAAWRPGTNAVYNSAWKKWHSWCVGREIDPLCPSLANITSFLAWSYNQGLEYRTINTYRSALSGVLAPIEGFAVGQHPLVARLLKGILNLRPAMPRYQHSWDVNLVLNYLRSLPNNEAISLKLLTHKLAMLLALTAPKRTSELKMLDIRFMRLLPEGIEFTLPGLTKTSSEKSSVFFAKFDDDENLCVLRCLQTYLKQTNSFRPAINSLTTPNQLLISYHRLHRPVKACSIARWIKSVMGNAGIDTTIFKGHSTRSASTSKARESGVSLEEVVKMADWSGPSTFIRFYYRPRFSDLYARAVLTDPS